MNDVCQRCSRVLVALDEAALFFLWLLHVLNKERMGCIGADLPPSPDRPTLGQILAEAKRERLH